MTRAGYRLVDHTADLTLEAWGEDRAACLAQAVHAMVASFADVDEVAAARRHDEFVLGPAPAEDVLVELLGEVIYLLDTAGAVPVEVDLHDREDGALVGAFGTVSVSAVAPSGAVPKAVTYHRLRVERSQEVWHCRVTIDV